jgi:transposase
VPDILGVHQPGPGPGYYETTINKNRKTRNHVRQLEALGYMVTLTPAA